jgi:hypothetical protein
MGQDVLRACHRWLLDHDTDYRHERLSIETWMEIHHLPPGQLESAVQRTADTAPKQTQPDQADQQTNRPNTPQQTSTPSTPQQNG